jgi:hypothetical protein
MLHVTKIEGKGEISALDFLVQADAIYSEWTA